MNEIREKVATYLDDYLYDVRSYDAKNVYEAADDIIELIDKERARRPGLVITKAGEKLLRELIENNPT
jgi:hypothetical protein